MSGVGLRTRLRSAGSFMAAAALITVAAADRVAAQDYRFGAGWNVGGAYFTPMNSNGSGTDIKLDPGWIIGAQIEQWLGSGRFGWRLNGALTERPLTLPGESRDIGVWLADFDLMARLLPADPDRTFNIFVSAGAGLIQYRLGDGEFLNFTPADAAYDGDDSARVTAVGGIGFDYITAWLWDGEPVGIRFEVVDHVAIESPFDPLSGTRDFSPIHNVRFVIGAFTGFGLLR